MLLNINNVAIMCVNVVSIYIFYDISSLEFLYTYKHKIFLILI